MKEATVSTHNAHGTFTAPARVVARLTTWKKSELIAKIVRVYDGCSMPECVSPSTWRKYSKAELAIMVGDCYQADF